MILDPSFLFEQSPKGESQTGILAPTDGYPRPGPSSPNCCQTITCGQKKSSKIYQSCLSTFLLLHTKVEGPILLCQCINPILGGPCCLFSDLQSKMKTKNTKHANLRTPHRGLISFTYIIRFPLVDRYWLVVA